MRSKMRTGIRVQRPPVFDGGFPQRVLRCIRTTLDIVQRDVVDRDQAGARARLDRHVADRHAPFHRQPFDRSARKLERLSAAAGGPDATDDREDQVFRVEPRTQCTRHVGSACSRSCAARDIASRARVRPPTCRCLARARRTHRASTCANHRTRSSCPAASRPARDRRRERCPAGCRGYRTVRCRTRGNCRRA